MFESWLWQRLLNSVNILKTITHWVVYFKWVNSIVCGLYLNIAITKRTYDLNYKLLTNYFPDPFQNLLL